MAANLTPQYLEAEQEYRAAQSAEERLAALKRMFTLVPKHKASEKLQADLKTKMSETRDEVEREKKAPKKGAGVSYKIPRQGAGTVVLLGAPNAGKSTLLAKLTKAKPEIAPYGFTTREPMPGMMDALDTRVQLVDTPPITADVMEPYLGSIVGGANAVALLVDLADDDAPFAAEAVIDKLKSVKKNLVGTVPEDDDFSVVYQKTLLVGTKTDADGAADRLEFVREVFADRYPMVTLSAETGEGLEELRGHLYNLLGVIRVYTKLPGKPADMTAPFTPRAGSTVAEFAGCVHADFVEKVKSARVWGEGVTDGQTVGRDHVLRDRNVVELNVG